MSMLSKMLLCFALAGPLGAGEVTVFNRSSNPWYLERNQAPAGSEMRELAGATPWDAVRVEPGAWVSLRVEAPGLLWFRLMDKLWNDVGEIKVSHTGAGTTVLELQAYAGCAQAAAQVLQESARTLVLMDEPEEALETKASPAGGENGSSSRAEEKASPARPLGLKPATGPVLALHREWTSGRRVELLEGVRKARLAAAAARAKVAADPGPEGALAELDAVLAEARLHRLRALQLNTEAGALEAQAVVFATEAASSRALAHDAIRNRILCRAKAAEAAAGDASRAAEHLEAQVPRLRALADVASVTAGASMARQGLGAGSGVVLP
jgi:hypothetical protein